MMDNLFNTKEKRFVYFYGLYGLIMIVFLYHVYRFSSLLLSIDSAQQLMILTDPNTRSIYWPIDAIAKIMDQRINFLNVTIAIVQSIPNSFYVGLFCLVYLASAMFDKKHTFYKYQQGVLVITFFMLVFQMTIILLFLYGFLGGSVASAISRLHVSGYVGCISSVLLVLLFFIVFVKLLIEFLDTNEKL